MDGSQLTWQVGTALQFSTLASKGLGMDHLIPGHESSVVLKQELSIVEEVSYASHLPFSVGHHSWADGPGIPLYPQR